MEKKKKPVPPKGFKKGISGNPGGRPALPEEIKKMSRETKPAIIASYHKLTNMTIPKFKEYKPANVLEAGIQKCLQNFQSSGKTQEIRHIWAECHGKPTESMELDFAERAAGLIRKISVEIVDHNDEVKPVI